MFNLCHFGGYFNPRPPWGGRPIRPTPQDHMPCYFNPRPPWGGRPCFRSRSRGLMYISIHALRGEGDKKLLKFLQVLLLFQSTPSVGRATLRTEHEAQTKRFQSTPSVGRATPAHLTRILTNDKFQSTPSVGRATSVLSLFFSRKRFQSTPSVGRATNGTGFINKYDRIFQSTPSVGRAT